MGRLSTQRVGLIENGGDFSVGIGGAEANVCIAASRLGADTTWVGRLGNDRMGDLIARRLVANGVTTSVTRDPGFTGLMICTRRTNTVFEVDYHRSGSAGSRLAPADLTDETLDTADVLHVTGITPALSGSAQEAVLAAVARARDRGILVSFDVNFRAKLWTRSDPAELLRTIAISSDIVFAGTEEAEILVGAATSTPADLAGAIAAQGPREVIVKLGERGSVALIDDTSYTTPAIATTMLDPVGAGDAFVAGYLVERINGQTAERRLDTAVRMGAIAVSVPGDCENLPFRDELDTLLATDDVIR
jgi:2-dehydro-3-deoxygluconokinase